MTEAELRQRAGNLLGILPLGQSLRHEHDVRLQSAYSEVYDQLKTEGLNAWGSTIPNEVAPHLIALVALNCADDIGVSNDRYTRIVNRAGIALREIRKHVADPYESLTSPEDF